LGSDLCTGTHSEQNLPFPPTISAR
jgi:hypothetical protein